MHASGLMRQEIIRNKIPLADKRRVCR